jgi:hypothetical protein
MIRQGRIDFGNNLFREILITGYWALWKTRNGIIFLTMGIEASIIGNTASERNLVWCVSRPKPPRDPYLALGKTITYELFVFSFVPCCLVFFPLYFSSFVYSVILSFN